MSTPGFFDTHAHLDAFGEELPLVLERARAAGVSHLITIGASDGLPPNFTAVELARTHADVYATVGIHPHDARLVTPEVMDALEALARDPKVVAVGETGLDYFYQHSPREQQADVFRGFVDLARRVEKPLVIHTRDADPDTIEILRATDAGAVGGIIHCFTGGDALADAALDLGFFLSFSGVLTFRNADPLRAIAARAPRDRVLVETDCPFLAPIPHRGKRNEPAYVVHTLAKLAELWGVSDAEARAITGANARRAFRLS